MTLRGLLIAATCSSQFDSPRSQAPTPPRHDRVCCSWMSARATNDPRHPLPADVVPGSYVWAPDGHWAAFLTQAAARPGGADFVALCAVDTSARGAISGFRYVADLGRVSDASWPLPVAAVAWSATGDGRLVYAAPTPKLTVSNPLGLPTTSGGEPGLFVATPGGRTITAEQGQRLGSATGLIAPAWPADSYQDGSALLALARSDHGISHW
jgi:hypothetical protein